MEKQLRYVVYCRKSTDEKNKQLLSIESQRAELQKLILREGLTVVGEPLEERHTAKKVGRPVFKQMLNMIDQGEANGIIVWKTDRLSRNSIDTAAILSRLESGAIQRIQTLERTYNYNENVILLYVEFGMADQYKRDLSSSVKVGMNTKIRLGWCPGRVPVGYLNLRTSDDTISTVVKDPERFTILKKCWQRLLERRYSLQQVYEMAIEDGLTNRNGGKYCRSNFYKLFQNPFYYGYFQYMIDGNPKLNKGQHEPMITKEEFDQAQAILSGDQKPRKHSHDFTYRGVFRCGRCGSLMSGYRKTKKQNNGNVHSWTYYICARGKDRHCHEPQLGEGMIDAEIARILGELEIPPQFHQWAMDTLRDDVQRSEDYTIELLQSRQRALEISKAKSEKLLDLLLGQAINQEAYDRKQAELRKEQERLSDLMVTAEKKIEDYLKEADKVFSFAELAKGRFMTGDSEEKRYAAFMLSLNPLVIGRKPLFTLFPVFEALKKIALLVRELSHVLEPVKGVDIAMTYTDKLGENPEWWAIQDLNL
ncbi:MAG TPA: hypothetical protein DEO67_07970 [Candidatus Edwardsbacteria bacterium]|nr:hypothetical protein [Candidatus Edwardsbacteria bacterium]